MLKNDKKMLIYGFNSDEEEIIKQMIENNKLPDYKIITHEMGKMKIRDIIENLKLEIYKCETPQEKVVLFNNFSDVEIDIAIEEIRKKFKPMPILAVVTEMSIDWTFEHLIKHLIEERNWHKNNQ